LSDGSRQEISLNGTGFVIPITPLPLEYTLTLEGLPAGYVLKSMKDGATDLTANPLRLTAANAPASVLRAFMVAPSLSNQAAAIVLPIASGTVAPQPSTIAVILDTVSLPDAAGVRVSGTVKGPVNRSIYLSGTPGTLYADGSFEFRSVAPGKHNIVTLDNPGSSRPAGTVVVVGDRDVSGLELREVLSLPANPSTPSAPGAAGGHPAGSTPPLAVVRGRVVEGPARLPLEAGRITINGNTAVTYSLGAEGRFEIPNLLPGTYHLSAWAYGLGSGETTVTIDEDDVEIEIVIPVSR
jgi:hypothetical protein